MVRAMHWGGDHYQFEKSEQSSETWSNSVPEQDLGEYTGRPLRLTGRPYMTTSQKVFTGLFYGQLLLQLGMMVWLWQTQNFLPTDGFGNCPSSYQRLDHMCISDRLVSDRSACLETEHNLGSEPVGTSWRRLEEKDNTVGGMLQRHLGVPSTTMMVAGLLCLMFFLALQFAAGIVTWGLFVLNILLMLWGCYIFRNWMLLVVVGILVAVPIWRKKDIDTAILAMGVGAEALKETPLVFLICGGIQLVWFVYALCVTWISVALMGNSRSIGASCDPSEMSRAFQAYGTIGPFLFLSTTFFCKHCILAVVSLAVGAWCFPEETALQHMTPTTSAVLALKLSLTTSCGSIYGASIILTVVEFVRRQMRRNFLWFVDPIALTIRILWCALESVIGALTRFALIGHMFQGDRLCHSANVTSGMLQRHLPESVMVGIVSERVTSQLSMMSSTTLGFAVWWYLDWQEGLGFFSGLQEVLSSNSGPQDGGFYTDIRGKQMLLVFLAVCMLYLVRNPVMTICITFLANLFTWGNGIGVFSAFSIAIVLASFAAIVFNYLASILEYASDTAFYCLALQAEEGSKREVRLRPLQDIVMQKTAESRLGE